MTVDELLLNADEIRRIAFAYPLEEDVSLFRDPPDWTACGAPSIDDLQHVVEWKANRLKTLFRDANTDDVVARVSREALVPFVHCEDPDVLNYSQVGTAVTALSKIDYVGVRMASAILTVYRPALFTVMDWRAWDTLATYGVDGIQEGANLDSVANYLLYLRVCHALRAKTGVSLRNIDRFLWVLGGTKDHSHLTYLTHRIEACESDRW